jgi:hypothetical protein
LEVSGDKKSTWICLDISPLFFSIVPRVVQALVITCDELFQALVVEAGVLLPKPFLDLGIAGVIRWKLAVLEMFSQFAKHLKVQGRQVGGVWLVGNTFLLPDLQQDVFCCHQGLENVIVHYDRCQNKFGTTLKNRGLMSKHIHPYAYLVSTCLHSPKRKVGKLTF